MKTIHILLSAIMLFALSFNALSKNPESKMKLVSIKKGSPSIFTGIHVAGNCNSCKMRIEKAAKDAGATFAEWNTDKQLLKISFYKDSCSVEKISKAVAAAGHDAGEFKADDKTYNSLPGCCKYERKK
jgi:hypothetical protein